MSRNLDRLESAQHSAARAAGKLSLALIRGVLTRDQLKSILFDLRSAQENLSRLES